MTRKPTMRELRSLRYAQARATARYGSNNLPKEGNRAPKPITLRRADYEAQKTAEKGHHGDD